MSRPMVGLGALALIIWPLVMNSYVETTTALAAWVSPKMQAFLTHYGQ